MILSRQAQINRLIHIWMRSKHAFGRNDLSVRLLVLSRALFFAKYSKTSQILLRHGKSISETSWSHMSCPPPVLIGDALREDYSLPKDALDTMNQDFKESLE